MSVSGDLTPAGAGPTLRKPGKLAAPRVVESASGTPAGKPLAPSALHRRRLREIWRSAGWPCCDMVEVELLCAGLLERVFHASGHQTVRVTDAGVALLGETLEKNRRARAAHEALVEAVAVAMTRAGRLAWRGLSLRARIGGAAGGAALADVATAHADAVALDGGTPADAPAGAADAGRWVMAMPDVYSIRHTSVEAYLEPVVHEIKVRRADLLADLRQRDKRAAYLQLGHACWYVLADGIADADEVPAECGVMVARADGRLDVARPAPSREGRAPFRMPFGIWMALARATPLPGWRDDDAQPGLPALAVGAAAVDAGPATVAASTVGAAAIAASTKDAPADPAIARAAAGQEPT